MNVFVTVEVLEKVMSGVLLEVDIKTEGAGEHAAESSREY